MNDVHPPRFVLRDLPLAARIVLACFLASVGVGYFSALVQLHFQTAVPGRPLPGPRDTVRIYHGESTSQLERLLDADERLPMNGSGSMRSAFTFRSGGWAGALSKRAMKDNTSREHAEQALRAEREGERLALLEWIRTGADRKAYEDNAFPVSSALAGHALTPDSVEEEGGRKTVKIKAILEARCERCHNPDAGSPAKAFPLDNYDDVNAYTQVETRGGGMSLAKLAQTSHVHLLGFGMLYGLTGLIFALSGYPGWMRLVLAPLPLALQTLEIVCCWWGGRAYPGLAEAIPATGAIIASGLFLQIILSLFNLFGRKGQLVLVVVMLAAAGGAYALKERIIDPYLATEAGGGTPVGHSSGSEPPG